MKYFRATYLPDVLSSTGKSLFVKSLSALQLSNFSHWEASFLLMLSLICLWGQKDTMRNPDLLFMVHLTTHLSESLWTKIMGDIPQHYLKNQTHITEMLPKVSVSLLQEEEIPQAIPEGGIAYSPVLSMFFLPTPVTFRRDHCHVD